MFDVRGEDERKIASISHAQPFDLSALESLEKDAVIVFHCHHGMRSYQAGSQVIAEGYTNVYNLEGGIHAWSLHIDPSVPTY